ncbi:MAG TPA: PRC-barrel domain-containing protein [Peptococcaceae bacterium]|nr:PRC-barrel domain-containing protein [Peptococcaceae bacterium]HQD54411.1 PRC-barrel domain-containing protein [Peptococcaceae bacterium]
MRKGREIKNLPVIDVISGQQLGYVTGFKIAEHEVLEGLYMVSPDQKVHYLSREAISRIGKDAVLVKAGSEQVILDAPSAWSAEGGLNGSAVMTSTGEVLGVLSDILFEETKGHILGYEVSDGYFKDLIWGRKVIPVANVLTWVKDTVIVDERV